MLAITKQRAWRALTEREPRADFIYAVRTTGVYCRPGCASRLPRQENVELFPDARAAEAAGFRPCKRCQPDQDVETDRGSALVAAACRRLAADDAVTTREVARQLNVSASYLSRSFRARLGVTPGQYRRRVRAERVRRALPDAPSVTAALYDAGYGAGSRFYDGVARELGMTPARARRGAVGETVCYVTASSTLGRVSIAWTERGVCHVALGDDDAALVRDLAQCYPRAQLEAAPAHPWVHAVIGAVDGGAAGAPLPLDLRGTAFQERVWQALARVPAGETRSYTDLARAVGRPTAARAVAAACAQNRVAVLVPCHRAVQSDGGLAGYRWGVERKRALLERERAPLERERKGRASDR